LAAWIPVAGIVLALCLGPPELSDCGDDPSND